MTDSLLQQPPVQEKTKRPASKVKRFLIRITGVVLGSACGAFVGLVIATVARLAPNTEYQHLAIYSPLPHHVSEFPGGLSLRFAMVHDVVHERFARHGTAYYQHRNRLTRQQLEKLLKDDPKRWDLVDDLCVGLERLGETEAAIPLMQAKLDQQRAAGISGIGLYTSLANLGTFLIHANFQEAQAGEPAAIERFEEGIELVRQATEVNPGAHFGRERWQLVIAEFLLDSFKNPNKLQQTDFIGNPLDKSYADIMNSEYTYYSGFGKASLALHYRTAQSSFPDFFPPHVDLDDPEYWDEFSGIRKFITKVGPEEVAVPFDEPVLGIIGMWREGGGANPHFSLALAETMLRVGQRYIAWTAYERTMQLAQRFSPDPAVQQFLKAHCQNRQAEIEASFVTDGAILGPAIHPEYPEQPPLTDEQVNPEKLRSDFEEELSLGLAYQQEYELFEAKQIAAGKSIDAADFYTPFNETHAAIATTPGREEMMFYIPRVQRTAYHDRLTLNIVLFSVGLGAFLTSLLIYLCTFESKLLRKQREPGSAQ